MAIGSYYSKDATLTVNGTLTADQPLGEIKLWQSIDMNKLIATDTTTAAFADTLNQGISAGGMSASTTYLGSPEFAPNGSNAFTEMIGKRPTNNQSWGVQGGKVLLGVENEGDSTFAGGEGTQESPYLIRTEAQLRAFAQTTVDGEVYTDKYVKLDADVALTSAWTPIHAFAGHFDGGNHIVSGMKIGTSEEPSDAASVGFFDYFGDNAQVSNFKLTDVAIYTSTTGTTYMDHAFAGGLVGGATDAGRNAKIDHCSVSGGEIVAASKVYSHVGGLAGLLTTNVYVTNCWTDVNVTATADDPQL